MRPLLLHSNTNQYNINGSLCAYTDMFRIQKCCNHTLSVAERFRGQEATCADPGIVVSFISPQLILQFTEGSMVVLLRKQYLYFITDPEGSTSFQGSNFFQGGGVQMLISILTHITCYFPGERGPDPLSPSGSAHGQCRHNGTILITVPLLTIIIRLLSVRINYR